MVIELLIRHALREKSLDYIIAERVAERLTNLQGRGPQSQCTPSVTCSRLTLLTDVVATVVPFKCSDSSKFDVLAQKQFS